MICPDCGLKAIPIHYGYVDFADIERAILGVIVIADKFGLEKWHCKPCNKSF